MEPRVRYIVVGLFALLSGLAGLFYALWIQNKGSVHDRMAILVRFEGTAAGLRGGAPVTFNGVRVGEVTKLTFEPSNPNGVMAFLALDPSTPVNAATQVGLESQGLLGAVYVSLTGGDPGQPLTVASGQTLPMLTARATTSLTQEARDALQGVKSLVSDNSAPFHEVVTNIQSFSAVLARNSDRVDNILQGLERTMAGGEKSVKLPMYDLVAPASVVKFGAEKEMVLVVNDPTAVVALDTQRLLHETAGGQISPQAVEWPDTIPKLVQKRIVQSFENAGYRFAVPPSDNANADYQLFVEVRAFQIVDGQEPAARVELGLRLAGQDGRIVDQHTISARSPAKAPDPESAVQAINQAYAQAMHDLLAWYAHVIAGNR